MAPPPKAGGVVVLFHPGPEVRENILSYLTGLRLLVMVDNSDRDNWENLRGLQSHGDIRYIHNRGNAGMARALNQGAEVALAGGCQWLLTMDQDSRFAPGGLRTLLACAEKYPDAGMLCPRVGFSGKDRSEDGGRGNGEIVPVAICSGSLLNLAAYRRTGPFEEKLFIDYVDYEYCLRLGRHSFPVRSVPSAKLEHRLGSLSRVRLLGTSFHPTHHAPLRKYYLTRNRLFVMRRYPRRVPSEIHLQSKELFKLLLFEDFKVRKLAYMALGALHFLLGRYGPLAAPAERRK